MTIMMSRIKTQSSDHILARCQYFVVATLYPFQLEMTYFFVLKILFFKTLQNHESDFVIRK